MIDRCKVWAACFASAWLLATGTAGAASNISWSSSQALGFGKFAAGSGGSVTITPAGSRSATGTVVLLSSGPGSAASFSLTGTPNFLAFSITLPANGTVALTRAGGGTMALTQFTSTPSGTGALNASGQQTINVGATLTVGSGAAQGRYTGTFEIFLNYE